MAGRVVRVCPPRDFDFSNLSTGTETVVVAERIDASQYDTIDVIVRVHTDSTISSGSIAVQVVSDGYTTDDPSVDFFSDTIGQGTTLSGSLSAGDMSVESLTSSDGIGAMVAVRVVGSAGSGVTARLSIDLAMKSC